jgi:hypothetical protein
LRRKFIAFHDDNDFEREKKNIVNSDVLSIDIRPMREFQFVFPIRLSMVNAVFDEVFSIVEILVVDTGEIKGKYRFVGTNGNDRRGNEGDG